MRIVRWLDGWWPFQRYIGWLSALLVILYLLGCGLYLWWSL